MLRCFRDRTFILIFSSALPLPHTTRRTRRFPFSIPLFHIPISTEAGDDGKEAMVASLGLSLPVNQVRLLLSFYEDISLDNELFRNSYLAPFKKVNLAIEYRKKKSKTRQINNSVALYCHEEIHPVKAAMQNQSLLTPPLLLSCIIVFAHVLYNSCIQKSMKSEFCFPVCEVPSSGYYGLSQ